MKNNLLLLLAFFVFATTAKSQQLLTPSYGFSKKKTSYLTLMDGTEVQGTIKDIDREKGLFKYIKVEDGAGKKHKLKAEDIKFMYLPPNGMDKLSQKVGTITDAQKWNNEKLNQDLLSQGYVYFETTDVKLKKKEEKLLMQLLNPDFCKYVKIYHDPRAKETMSVGVGGVDVAGGNAKSYYISKEGAPAILLKKKEYKEEFIPLWKACGEVKEQYPTAQWSDLVAHLLTYSACVES